MSDFKLSLEYYHKDPVEINVFSEALLGLASTYERFLIKNIKEGEKVDSQSRLYINQIRSGSILIELVDLFPIALAFFENSNTIVEFTKHFAGLVNVLTGKASEGQLAKYDKNDLKDIVKFVQPVSKDRSAQYNIAALNVHGDVIVNLGINTKEGNQIEVSAQEQIKLLGIPEGEFHKKVIFYWFQARSESGTTKQVGLSGRIDSIYSKPLKVIIAEDSDREKMLGMNDNPFKKAFVVDVFVDSVQGVPFAFKILKVYEIFDL